MIALVKAAGGAVVVAGLIAGAWVVWLFGWDCCPHEDGDDE